VRAAALLLTGLWLGALVASWVAASTNFRTVDRVLGPTVRPELAQSLANVPPAEQRMALRHLASEINRWMFRSWCAAQVALGVVLLWLAWPAGATARLLVGAALLIVVAQALLTVPIVSLGRSLDFLPRPLPPPLAHRFGALHAAYVLADLGKAGLLAAAAWALARGQR
jgi:hypothetical protein